jgi:hypothetical protein
MLRSTDRNIIICDNLQLSVGGGETVEKSKKKSLGLGGIFRKRPKMAPGQVDNDFWRRGRFWTKIDDFGCFGRKMRNRPMRSKKIEGVVTLVRKIAWADCNTYRSSSLRSQAHVFDPKYNFDSYVCCSESNF